MKKIYLFLTALMLCVAAGAQTTIKGDVNGDGTVDIADVTEVVNIILNPDSDDDIPAVPDTPTTDSRAIDLGLSVKWASCNVGATAPEEYGGYYAWGETEEKSDYSWAKYKHSKEKTDYIIKYCTDSIWGYVDNKIILEPDDDVATAKWGGNWRMPTRKEFDELKNNCIWSDTTINNVKGSLVTGPNGSSIFLPYSGYRYNSKTNYVGSFGVLWSSRLGNDMGGCNISYCIVFKNASQAWNGYYRFIGCPVRPVCP